MLDIKLIKENPEKVKQALARRNKDYSAEVDRLVELDLKRRELLQKTEAMKAEQNAASKALEELKEE